MGPRDEKKAEKIEIICPCGHQFDPPDGEGEFACPACSRVHILHGVSMLGDPNVDPKGDTTVEAPPPMIEIKPGDRIGPYAVTGFIGEGGMGRVYAGEDPNLRRKVAIKLLSRQLLDKRDFVARFEREARAIARLNNPNIVQIYFTGVHNGVPYYAMEMVPGGSLELFKNADPMKPTRAIELMLDAARGLSAAAEEGVIHRDIKPSNLMIDRTGRLKITDFGLAKTVAIDSAITHTGTIIGTPYYMSPEQGESEPLDLRADIYSLGATFYHLLAGSPPFEADSPIGVILKHINEPLKPLQKRNRNIPRPLASVIEKMMAKDPRDRYESYDALIRDLRALQQGLPPEGPKARKRPSSAARTPADSTSGTKRKSFIVLDREILDSDEMVALRRCGMFRRLMAFAMDFGILCLLYTLYMQKTHTLSEADQPIPLSLWSALFLLISFLYFFLGDARGGMTLGKTLFRCRLGMRDGENLGFGKSFIRTLLFFPMLLAPGAMVDDIPSDSPLLTFAKAIQDLFYSGSVQGMDSAVILAAQICLIWSLISLGFFFLTPGKTHLHDLITGSFLFSFQRRKPVEEKAPASVMASETARPLTGTPPVAVPIAAPSPTGNPSPSAGGAPEPLVRGATGARRLPPPIPKAALQKRTSAYPIDRTAGMTIDRPYGYRPKSPRLALVLSIIPGLGQVYNGDFMKGLLIFLTFWLILPWILGVLDAYFKARWINRQAGY